MKLIGMLDSPYVRRVAISLAHYGMAFEHQSLSVFRHFDQFAQINGVVKAPTLVLADGSTLMDSSLILHYLESLADTPRKLLPITAAALAKDTQILGLALAASDKAVQFYYERTLRPEEKQHQPWLDRVTQQLLAACTAWNAALEQRDINPQQPDQVAISSAVIWGFIQSIIPQVVPAEQYPRLQQVAAQLEGTAIFAQYPPV
ncbi:glutathione S-transferase [Pantoea sp. At-9b]|uniref:glutathione S-transferase n=1 Tax=Pantoea sp. (strain At-9b) TaxID=592316 RepID=UPI0001B40774|nr:glutathione S-transferase [Pantoea sp. At-9b]ADU69835.1 Glutathione S-transferase domain protein [Pantoea sp. At-9b]